MSATRDASSTIAKTLTRQTADGAIYMRRVGAQVQIEKIIALEFGQILEMLAAGEKRDDEDFLLDETLVYLLRR